MTALKDGKISAAQKAWAEEYALKDPQGFKKLLKRPRKWFRSVNLKSRTERRSRRGLMR
ncbi:phage protease [Paenibacillus melissococcoides]|uniref:Phage protease n=1 Tax=Paenibacillus melissococcoides TaxID=2912268 RepID=A0ABN8UGS4_9BACL|nr:phage protease [Paenibacillus melissococcoides]CAH8248816.1 phage protease [Paenibacillus melissococcoides]CAH8249004.1 phage protease [Paenibacillus melissococcoides]CAH8249196.1 phage protease [Paenibacillus melissococcoides]CAH8249589.1 phage protease [Paenibacillus melissococcoides]